MKLHKCFTAWSQGNKRGKIGGYWFTKDTVFEGGVPVCVRFRDLAGKPIVLVRFCVDFEPETVFKGRRWAYVTPDQFASIPALFKRIAELQCIAQTRRRHIEINQLHELGSVIEKLKSVKLKIRDGADLYITDLAHEDKTILGAYFLLRGKASAICVASDEHGWEKSYKVFETFDDAIMFKLKNNGVKLYDLT